MKSFRKYHKWQVAIPIVFFITISGFSTCPGQFQEHSTAGLADLVALNKSFFIGSQGSLNQVSARETGNYSEMGFQTSQKTPSEWSALLRSFVIPGWGHHYVDSGNWGRGQLHLGAEIVIVAAYMGISRQSYVLQKNMFTHAKVYSGIDIGSHDRQFELAVGNYNSLAAYNDFQQRTRNVDRIYPDEPQYRWEWQSDELRRDYQTLRSRRDDLQQQLPALAALMVANRVISGISAFSRARTYNDDQASLVLNPGPDFRGVQATLTIPF